jgi:hypothetical protein
MADYEVRGWFGWHHHIYDGGPVGDAFSFDKT